MNTHILKYLCSVVTFIFKLFQCIWYKNIISIYAFDEKVWIENALFQASLSDLTKKETHLHFKYTELYSSIFWVLKGNPVCCI